MTTYSSRLWRGEILVATGAAVIFTVPAGKRVVVRDVSGHFTAGTTPALLLHAVSANIPFLRVSASTVPGGFQWTGRQVIHEGENCYTSILGTGGAARFTVSGYVLDGAGGALTTSFDAELLPAE